MFRSFGYIVIVVTLFFAFNNSPFVKLAFSPEDQAKYVSLFITKKSDLQCQSNFQMAF